MAFTTIEIVAYTAVGLGWFIAVICILRNFYDWTRGRYVCLLSDIVKATFATITIALVINISLIVYVDMSNADSEITRLHSDANARERTIGELIAETKNLSQMNMKLTSDIETLSKEISRLQDKRTLVSDLRDFWQLDTTQNDLGVIDKEKVTRLLEKHIGSFSDEYDLHDLQFHIRLVNSNEYLDCSWDNPYLYCVESG